MITHLVTLKTRHFIVEGEKIHPCSSKQIGSHSGGCLFFFFFLSSNQSRVILLGGDQSCVILLGGDQSHVILLGGGGAGGGHRLFPTCYSRLFAYPCVQKLTSEEDGVSILWVDTRHSRRSICSWTKWQIISLWMKKLKFFKKLNIYIYVVIIGEGNCVLAAPMIDITTWQIEEDPKQTVNWGSDARKV